MPQLCIGYKLDVVKDKEIVKRSIICDIISDLYFSKITPFFEEEYNKGILSDVVNFDYEGSSSFSHIIISAYSTNIEELKKDLTNYLDEIKTKDVDDDMFELIKKKKIGDLIKKADNLNVCYRRIIDSALNNYDVYEDVNILNNITKEDIKEFLKLLDNEKQVFSILKQK